MSVSELEKVQCGKIYTTNFKSYKLTWELLPEAMWFAVTRNHSFKRGSGEDAEWRRLTIVWIQCLAPSKELRYAVRSGEIDWLEFTERYLEEMNEPEPFKLLSEIAHCVAAGRDVVLMCYEARGKRCHRYLLANMLEKLVRQKQLELFGCMFRLGSPTGGELCHPTPPRK